VDSVRAANLAMWMIGWYVMVPISLASLLTGLVQSLGTRWGLFRHYWVLFKLMLNLIATAVLLLYTQTLDHLAQTAAVPGSTIESLRNPSPTIHAGGALVLLAAATVLAVYKPQGVTRYGPRVAGTRATVRQR
jgi:hypothetical protein